MTTLAIALLIGLLGIAIEFDAIETTVEGDKGLLETALRNLLANSIRHATAPSAIRVRMTAQSVIIEDDSGGFPDEVIRDSQKRFFVVPSTTGSGLGLPTVQMIAELHNGRLILENIAPNIARVTLSLNHPTRYQFLSNANLY